MTAHSSGVRMVQPRFILVMSERKGGAYAPPFFWSSLYDCAIFTVLDHLKGDTFAAFLVEWSCCRRVL